jgi:hypothetical protein
MEQVNPVALNLAQRRAVLDNAVEMQQLIYSGSVAPASQNTLNIQPRNVGLIKGFIVEVTATLANGAVNAATRTGFGSANLVRNFQFNDLNNYVRINTPGWHIALLNSARQGWLFGGAYAGNLAMGYGNNWNVNEGAANLAALAESDVRHIYYVPLAYSGDDLRGAVYAGVVSATMNLQIQLNTTPFVAAGSDPLTAVYTGNANGGYKAATTVNINVYQVYLDQIPVMNGGPILPMLDLNTIYELKSTALTGVSAGQDFPVPYANFRDYLSTVAIFRNGAATYNVGSDVNYWSLTSANFTNLFKIGPEIAALQARQVFMADPPSGVYYFNHRSRPINTLAFGNMELNLNASSAPAGSQIVTGYEMFSQVTQLSGPAASSLPAG